jgi:hypothetical protein
MIAQENVKECVLEFVRCFLLNEVELKMFFLKALASYILVFFCFAVHETFASETDPIIDKKPKLHLCTSSLDGNDVLFFVEKYRDHYNRVPVFEEFRFSADNVSKKWSCKTSFSNEKPEVLGLRTLSFTEDDYALLHTYLSDPGSDIEFDFINGGNKILSSSSASELLKEIRNIPKFVSFGNDTNENNYVSPWRIVCQKKVVIGAVSFAAVLLIIYSAKDSSTNSHYAITSLYNSTVNALTHLYNSA